MKRPRVSSISRSICLQPGRPALPAKADRRRIRAHRDRDRECARPQAAAAGTRLPYRVLRRDDTAAMEIVFFTPHEDHISESLPVGSRRIVSGRIDSFGGRLQMAHPDFIAAPTRRKGFPTSKPCIVRPINLPARMLAKAVRQALERLPDLASGRTWLGANAQGWPGFAASVRAAHAPESEDDLSSDVPKRACALPMTSCWPTSWRLG